MDPIEVPLSRTYTYKAPDFGAVTDTSQDRTFSELTLREPLMEDIEAAAVEAGAGAEEIVRERILVARCSGLPGIAIGKLSGRDWNRVEAKMLLFFDDPDFD